jgi:hypothetical protein
MASCVAASSSRDRFSHADSMMSFIFQIFVKGKEFETIEMKQISTKKGIFAKKYLWRVWSG